MLNIQFGDMPEAIDNTSTYLKNIYKDSWITSELSRAMIADVDRSTVISERLIDSPVLGTITPAQLSGGVKALMLIAYDRKHVFNASNCGDNCAKWILKIAEERKDKVLINLRHLMDFGEGEFRIRVVNTNKIVRNMAELVFEACDFV